MEPIYQLQSDPHHDGGVRVRLSGEVDVSVVEEVHDALAELVADLTPPPSGEVALDLSDLEFIDSSGIRMLLQTALDAEPSGLHIRVVALSDSVRRVFDIAGVNDLLRVVPRGERNGQA